MIRKTVITKKGINNNCDVIENINTLDPTAHKNEKSSPALMGTYFTL